MEQEINIKEKLTNLMVHPENVGPEDAPLLREMVSKYPFFQPLYPLLARANRGGSTYENDLASAALYTSGLLTYNVLHQPDKLLSANFNEPLKEKEAEEPEELTLSEVHTEPQEEPPVRDEQETFEEITEVNVSDFLALGQRPEQDAEVLSKEDPALENLVSSDFFAFRDNFIEEDVAEAPSERIPRTQDAANAEITGDIEEQVISKYDDDKMPYTFLWWLAKTRKEHQQIFQPYASPKHPQAAQLRNQPPLAEPEELQQQYVENIFHMQSAFGDQDTEALAPVKSKKGDEIIETFIKNEPQISPPRPDKINTENRARKSAEDRSDLVSETLAKIYIEQMLYDKAIETYEKLSLMFPEKSRYFADLIQSIEKKI